MSGIFKNTHFMKPSFTKGFKCSLDSIGRNFMRLRRYLELFILLMSFQSASLFGNQPGNICNVRDFGAKGDGQTDDTYAIQQAIDACSMSGGGQILLPPGRYLSGTIRLKSHIVIHLDAGATLLGSKDLERYSGFTKSDIVPCLVVDRWYRGLLVGEDAEDVTIEGPGTIDGHCVYDPNGEEKMRGPHTILFGRCRDFSIRDLHIKEAGNYAILFQSSDRVEIKRVKISGGWDGVHFRGTPENWCHDVNIIDCQFYTGDDCIAGNYIERAVINNCILNTGCNGIRLIGPAKGLFVNNCLIYGPGVNPHRTTGRYTMEEGICLQPSAWSPCPGPLEDVLLSNLTIHNVRNPFHIVIKKGNSANNIRVERITASRIYGMASSVESWAEKPISNVVFRDVTIEYEGCYKLDKSSKSVDVPGLSARPLPVWGFYAHRVDHLEFDNVRLRCLQNDPRPAFQIEHIVELDLDSFNFRRHENAPEPFILTDVELVRLRQSDIKTREIRNSKTVVWK